MRKITWLFVAALFLGACGDGNTDDTTDVTVDEPADGATDDMTEPAGGDATEPAGDSTEPAGDAMSQAAIQTADSPLGTILVDSEGMTLYMFDNDSDGESVCYDDCAANWPPLEGPVEAGDGVDASLLGTTERTDGTMQVTYAGMPLYYFAADQAAGDTNGQGVGDVWWVVQPDGTPVTEAAS